MNLPNRKPTRLKTYDYSTEGAYFVTLCTKEQKRILSEIIVGDGVLDVPRNILSEYGEIAEKYIQQMCGFYDWIHIEKYVVMPNHIHMIIHITDSKQAANSGTSRTPSPTNRGLPQFISTFKRFCNKAVGENIWQRSYHDRIIRNEQEYRKIWEYVDTNVIKWDKDCFYTEQKVTD